MPLKIRSDYLIICFGSYGGRIEGNSRYTTEKKLTRKKRKQKGTQIQGTGYKPGRFIELS